MSRAAVFLDRDGVLNQPVVIDGRPHPPGDAEGLKLEPGVDEACRRLAATGAALVVVTNQPDIARGATSAEVVAALNSKLRSLLPLDAVYVCPHDDRDGCDCRKPQPGLLLAAARELDLDLERSVMVGDRWRDVEAGRRAGVATVFVDRGWAETRPEGPDLVAPSLLDATAWIARRLAD